MSISALVELALGHDLRSTQAAKTPLNIYIYIRLALALRIVTGVGKPKIK